MSTATQQLAHSRDRIRRHLVRSVGTGHPQQHRARSRRRKWVGVALAVGMLVAVLAWHRPWRRSSGVARTVALAVACMKAPGMLHTLAGHVDTLLTWWRTFTSYGPPGGMGRHTAETGGTANAPAQAPTSAP